MKSIFVVIDYEENGKHCAVADTIHTGNNLVPIIKRYKANVCHLCESRKQADEIAMSWNAAYKAQGRYLYG